jgi:hypothetical protein
VGPGICGISGHGYDQELIAEFFGTASGSGWTSCQWRTTARAIVISSGAEIPGLAKFGVEVRTGGSSTNQFVSASFQFRPWIRTLLCADLGDDFNASAFYKQFVSTPINCLQSYTLPYAGDGIFESAANPKKCGPFGAWWTNSTTRDGIPLDVTVYPAP